MADTDQAKRDADKKEAERREAEQKRLRDEQTARTYQGHGETPTPTQSENDRTRDTKERADKSAKEVEARTAQFYDHEDPTPTQAENDAAMLAALGQQQELPEGSGFVKAEPSPTNRKMEADKSGGYATRSSGKSE